MKDQQGSKNQKTVNQLSHLTQPSFRKQPNTSPVNVQQFLEDIKKTEEQNIISSWIYSERVDPPKEKKKKEQMSIEEVPSFWKSNEIKPQIPLSNASKNQPQAQQRQEYQFQQQNQRISIGSHNIRPSSCQIQIQNKGQGEPNKSYKPNIQQVRAAQEKAMNICQRFGISNSRTNPLPPPNKPNPKTNPLPPPVIPPPNPKVQVQDNLYDKSKQTANNQQDAQAKQAVLSNANQKLWSVVGKIKNQTDTKQTQATIQNQQKNKKKILNSGQTERVIKNYRPTEEYRALMQNQSKNTQIREQKQQPQPLQTVQQLSKQPQQLHYSQQQPNIILKKPPQIKQQNNQSNQNSNLINKNTTIATNNAHQDNNPLNKNTTNNLSIPQTNARDQNTSFTPITTPTNLSYNQIKSKWHAHKEKIVEALKNHPEYSLQTKQLIAAITINDQLTTIQVAENHQSLVELANHFADTKKKSIELNIYGSNNQNNSNDEFGTSIFDIRQFMKIYKVIEPRTSLTQQQFNMFKKNPNFLSEFKRMQIKSNRQLRKEYIQKKRKLKKQTVELIESSIQCLSRQKRERLEGLFGHDLNKRMDRFENRQRSLNIQLDLLYDRFGLDKSSVPRINELTYMFRQSLEMEQMMEQVKQDQPFREQQRQLCRNGYPHQQIINILKRPLEYVHQYIQQISEHVLPKFNTICQKLIPEKPRS